MANLAVVKCVTSELVAWLSWINCIRTFASIVITEDCRTRLFDRIISNSSKSCCLTWLILSIQLWLSVLAGLIIVIQTMRGYRRILNSWSVVQIWFGFLSNDSNWPIIGKCTVWWTTNKLPLGIITIRHILWSLWSSITWTSCLLRIVIRQTCTPKTCVWVRPVRVWLMRWYIIICSCWATCQTLLFVPGAITRQSTLICKLSNLVIGRLF